MTRAPRIALIGARRVRQGLGPFVARQLRELGAELPCVLGTRPETVAESEGALGVRGYTDLREMIAREQLDALAILSPAETHERYLEAALAARLHVLCEKPLLWGAAGLAQRAALLAERFAGAGLLLRESCQWPYTLSAFRALHPAPSRLERFAMRLSPASRDPREMLGDVLSHPLSLLQALCGEPQARVEEVSIAARPGEVQLHFRYCAATAALACELTLRSSEQLPREAGYAVNGCWVERRVRAADYAMSFQAGERAVLVADPLRALLRAFLAALPEAGAVAATDPAIPARMALLEQILAALPDAAG